MMTPIAYLVIAHGGFMAESASSRLSRKKVVLMTVIACLDLIVNDGILTHNVKGRRRNHQLLRCM